MGLKKIIIFFAVCLFAVIAALAYLIFVTKDCVTTECFVKAANDCRKAKLEIVDDADMFWRYRAAAFCGGLEKTLVFLNDKETAPMKELLEGKSLSCNYTKGNFDKRWVTSLIFGLDNCHGELKENLGQLLFLAQ
jgi:uncharacterized protein YxeA